MPAAGASRLFSPQHSAAESAQQALQHLCQRDPRTCGCDQTRWTLAALRRTCDWLGDLTLAGVHTVLKRLGIVWKRARSALRSPDPNYEAKLAEVAAVLAKAQAAPGRLIAVFLDEITLHRQPTLANAYAPRGHEQPRAQREPRATRKPGPLRRLRR